MENIMNYIRTLDLIDKNTIIAIATSLLARNIELVIECGGTKIALRVS